MTTIHHCMKRSITDVVSLFVVVDDYIVVVVLFIIMNMFST
jgi:hypothetical protein